MPPPNKPYECTVEGCDASFSRPSKLDIHSRTHTRERPFMCIISGCDKSYTNNSHLLRHVSLAHKKSYKKLDKFLCTVEGCGKVLSNKYSLQNHISRHTRPFNCLECSKSFLKKRQLHEHTYIHTGIAPYKCVPCNREFTDSSLYNQHLKNHKTFTCDCGATFDRWSYFVTHRKSTCAVKLDPKCPICNKTFTRKRYLRIHSILHLEESEIQTHRCHYLNCKRSYRYKKNLYRHITSYHKKTLTRKVVCTEPDCERVLKSTDNLRRHLRTVHGQVPKEIKSRRPRLDKGQPKKAMAAVLSGIEIPHERHKALLHNTKPSDDLSAASSSSSQIGEENKDVADNVDVEENEKYGNIDSSGSGTDSNDSETTDDDVFLEENRNDDEKFLELQETVTDSNDSETTDDDVFLEEKKVEKSLELQETV